MNIFVINFKKKKKSRKLLHDTIECMRIGLIVMDDYDNSLRCQII